MSQAITFFIVIQFELRYKGNQTDYNIITLKGDLFQQRLQFVDFIPQRLTFRVQRRNIIGEFLS